jgi:hypothetical protein
LRPSQASLAATHHETETATGPGASPAGLAAAKPAATRPPKQIAPDSGSREVPAPKAVEPQVSPAAPLSQQPGAGIVAGNRPARPWSPQSEMTAAPPPRSSPREASTAPRPGRATPQPGLASQRGPQEAAGKTSLEKPRTNSRAPITVRELTETNIAILNGNGIHDLARATRSQLHLEGYNVVAINNFRDFGVDRTVIYYRPEAERVATILNKKYFPGAKFEPAPGLTDNIDVKIVLGHDLGSLQQAEAPEAHGPRL